jgi:hypothetical protein
MAHENKGDKPRLIAPASILLKCVDGRWIDTDGLIPTGEMLAVGTTRGLQRFNGKGELPLARHRTNLQAKTAQYSKTLPPVELKRK